MKDVQSKRSIFCSNLVGLNVWSLQRFSSVQILLLSLSLFFYSSVMYSGPYYHNNHHNPSVETNQHTPLPHQKLQRIAIDEVASADFVPMQQNLYTWTGW